MMETKSKLHVDLEFHAVSLPPVKDVLVLGKKYPQGKVGVMESFRFVAPDEFEMFEMSDEESVAEAVMINKRILTRMSAGKVIDMLRKHVFPYMSAGEAINVNLDIKIHVSDIEISQ
jgi:hypothetical protein